MPMKNSVSFVFTSFFAILLIPYFVTIVFNGVETALISRTFDVESCIPLIVSFQINDNYEQETVEAQTIIARTNIYKDLENGKKFFDIWKETRDKLINTYSFFSLLGETEIYEKAAEETKNQVLVYNGELKRIPYHEISSGETRDGVEVMHSEEYTYLKSVDSSQDKASTQYLSSSYISAAQMPENLEILERDSKGYVTKLAADGNVLEGEAFSQGMGLASSNFTIQKIGEEFRFLCKGKGHGLGFSQYGGNVLARAGNSCEEILEYYFPVMEITDINRLEMN
jgi:stage II sporulation protein D